MQRRCRFSLRLGRQRQRELTALTGGTADRNFDPMAGENAVPDREAEAAPLTDPLGREKRLENSLDCGFVHAVTSIRYRQANTRSRLRAGRRLPWRGLVKAYRYAADSAADCLGGIGHQVDDHLM